MGPPLITIDIESGGRIEIDSQWPQNHTLLMLHSRMGGEGVLMNVHEVEALVVSLRSELAIMQENARLDGPGGGRLF